MELLSGEFGWRPGLNPIFKQVALHPRSLIVTCQLDRWSSCSKEAQMAVVTRFERQNIQRAKRHPTKTECSGGVSRTYQFTVESARELLDALCKAFPGLR